MALFRWSWFAAGVTAVYILLAGYVIRDELRYTGGGWINLRGMGTMIATLPSYATLGNLLEWLGVPKVNYSDPRVGDYVQLVTHVLVSAVFVYAVALGLQLLARRLLAPQ
jgi:hypothetical protein